MGAQLIGIVLGFIEGAFFCFVLSANCDVMNKNEQIKRAKEARKALNNGNNRMVVGGGGCHFVRSFLIKGLCLCVCSHRFVIKQ